jgi:uncharacterized protein DUF559
VLSALLRAGSTGAGQPTSAIARLLAFSFAAVQAGAAPGRRSTTRQVAALQAVLVFILTVGQALAKRNGADVSVRDGAGFALVQIDRRDRRKDVLLQENGYHVLRFLCEDIGKRLDEILDAIIRALSHRCTRSTEKGRS